MIKRSAEIFELSAGTNCWAEYQGAFDDWIAAGAPGLTDPPRELTPPQDLFHDPFYAWLGARDAAESVSVWRDRPPTDTN